MTVMAILQDADKCMRCNGCVLACKREWATALPPTYIAGDEADAIAAVKPQRSVVKANQRLAIKSNRRGDMGPFVRFTCWHCPDPPCAGSCPFGAIVKQESGAVSVDNTKCDPSACHSGVPGAPYPCEIGCQRGGYPKVGFAYEATPDIPVMNKCTLCHGRAGSNAQITAAGGDSDLGLPTRATEAEIIDVPEKAHEPACVSSCPAKAMKWDTRANILEYLNDPTNGYYDAVTGAKSWGGSGSIYWASRSRRFTPPKADPFIEDHVAPMASSILSTGRLVLPTLVVGGLAAFSARRAKNEELEASMTEEV
jgi:Fe-S-cluster-containing dehydrogenase component